MHTVVMHEQPERRYTIHVFALDFKVEHAVKAGKRSNRLDFGAAGQRGDAVARLQVVGANPLATARIAVERVGGSGLDGLGETLEGDLEQAGANAGVRARHELPGTRRDRRGRLDGQDHRLAVKAHFVQVDPDGSADQCSVIGQPAA